ncbi:hypothetical protein BDY24DRAFT_278790 [Mrakia frigida]|uniref:uncharacterized protein n=1 Tax=Mrakia frigida TaxID=29902 RepID=UPI003FCBF950
MEEGVGGGRVMGMTRRAVGGVASRTEGWSWGWKLCLGLAVCLLVLPALRRLMGRMYRSRDEEKMQRLEQMVGQEELVDVEELRSELGAPRGVRGLMRGVVGEWCKGLVFGGKTWLRVGGGGGKRVELERKGWERVAERQMSLREFSSSFRSFPCSIEPKPDLLSFRFSYSLPATDLKSYLASLYTYLRLANLSSSLSSTSSPRTLSLLSLLSISLAGGDITPAASALWSSARAALPSSPSRPQDRAMAEVLELTLTDVLAISPEAFSSTTTSPLDVIASSLTLRDILHVWQTLFSSFAPPSSSLIPPTNLVAASPSILADRSRKALISSEIASLVASTTPGSEAHELALVCMGGWSLLVREEEGVKWSLGRLVGQGIQRSLGAGGKALLSVGGVVGVDASSSSSSSSSSRSIEDVVVDHHADEGLVDSNFTSSITHQINTLSSFLITYQSLVLSLPALTSKTNSTSTKLTSFPTLLPQTLHLRALLNSPDLEQVDEDAKERFVDGLYGLGRWSVGWRDVGEEDSGFSE